ncbi:MAG: hypothetical protein LBH11_02360 [Propionibacteriaceae bacterium]|jgi:hypothetical protein|nr:hypothetical protein [Propionibacteriaceae bacterium]
MIFKRIRVAVVAAAAIAFTITTSACSLFGASRDDNGTLTDAATIHINDTEVGDCLVDFLESGDSIDKVKAVPCTMAHDSEVFAKTANALASSESWAGDYCLGKFAEYIGIEIDESILDFYFVYPQANSTDRTVVCIVFEPGVTDSTDSLKGVAR